MTNYFHFYLWGLCSPSLYTPQVKSFTLPALESHAVRMREYKVTDHVQVTDHVRMREYKVTDHVQVTDHVRMREHAVTDHVQSRNHV